MIAPAGGFAMRQVVPLLAVVCLAFAPAPFPKPDRHPIPRMMDGVWDVSWGGMPVRLTLRPDGSARFEYTSIQGTWDGSWKFDAPERRVTLTLMINNGPQPYVLAFSVLGRDAAEGKILDSPTSSRSLKLIRSGRK
jgi:hypothetical protein